MSTSDAAVRHRAAGRSCRSSPNEHVLMYTCGITPYDATHLGHAATFLAYDVLQRRLIDLGHTRDVRAQRHRRRRPAVRQGPPARRALPRPGGRGGGPVRARHGGAQRPAGGVGAAGVVGDPRHPRLHRHGARPRLRLPGRRRGVLRRRRSSTAFGSVEPLHARRDARARPRARRRRRQPAQAPPARLRAVAAVGARRAVVGHDVGARAGPAGTSSAAPWRCASWARRSTSTAAAPT